MRTQAASWSVGAASTFPALNRLFVPSSASALGVCVGREGYETASWSAPRRLIQWRGWLLPAASEWPAKRITSPAFRRRPVRAAWLRHRCCQSSAKTWVVGDSRSSSPAGVSDSTGQAVSSCPCSPSRRLPGGSGTRPRMYSLPWHRSRNCRSHRCRCPAARWTVRSGQPHTRPIPCG